MSERAFPIENPRVTEQRGMTLRDYFAAKAMQAFITRHGIVDLENMMPRCYQAADAMLKAREEK